MKQVLIVDNYDSFTYNLVHLVADVGGIGVTTLRNDDESLLYRVGSSEFDGIIIGPGPGSPDDPVYFGKCVEIINRYGKQGLPILGVCLGFQGIAQVFGASLKKATQPVHGKLSQLSIRPPSQIFDGVSGVPQVMRYNSIMIDPDMPWPDTLKITAEVDRNEQSVLANGREIMAVEHKELPIYGVQFHPESYASSCGSRIMKNFINQL